MWMIWGASHCLVGGLHTRHIKVTNMTRVKSPKVGTILPYDSHAELDVIACIVASVPLGSVRVGSKRGIGLER